MKILILIFLLIPSLIIAKERLLVCKNFFGDGGEVIFKHKDSLIKKDEIFIRRSTGVWQNVKNYLEEDVFGIYTNVEIIKYEISKDGGYAEFFTPRLISLENIIVGVLISNLTNLEKQKLI